MRSKVLSAAACLMIAACGTAKSPVPGESAAHPQGMVTINDSTVSYGSLQVKVAGLVRAAVPGVDGVAVLTESAASGATESGTELRTLTFYGSNGEVLRVVDRVLGIPLGDPHSGTVAWTAATDGGVLVQAWDFGSGPILTAKGAPRWDGLRVTAVDDRTVYFGNMDDSVFSWKTDANEVSDGPLDLLAHAPGLVTDVAGASAFVMNSQSSRVVDLSGNVLWKTSAWSWGTFNDAGSRVLVVAKSGTAAVVDSGTGKAVPDVAGLAQLRKVVAVQPLADGGFAVLDADETGAAGTIFFCGIRECAKEGASEVVLQPNAFGQLLEMVST